MYLPLALDRAWKCIGCMWRSTDHHWRASGRVGLPRQGGASIHRETVSGLCNGRNVSVSLSFHFHKTGPIRPPSALPALCPRAAAPWGMNMEWNTNLRALSE